MAGELWRKSASELAQRIRRRETTSREVVEAHLARIEDVNGHVNAITVVLAESALAAAAADQATPTGPLHGVPFTIKENIDCVGSPTTDGVPAFAERLPSRDAPVVSRMKGAGTIPLARTNLPEFGSRLDTDNPLRGRTRNPWDGARTPGGSSGGEGAALATGMTPIGLGNDIGGSVRNPAYCCGIASLKPTQGRIPRASAFEPQDMGMSGQAMLVEGPMARSVADLRLALSILAGRDIRDPRSVDAPLQGPAPTRRRAALVTQVPEIELPPSTVGEIPRAGRILTEQGWEVEEVNPPELDRVTEVWGNLIAIDDLTRDDATKDLLTPALFASMQRLMARFDASHRTNAEVHSERSRLGRLWSAFLTDYPVAVGPTWSCLPWPADADLDPDTGIQTLVDSVRFITPANLLGLPAVALPMGVADGLPTGIQVYADLWREDLCLSAAETIEAAAPMPTPIDPVR